MRNMTGRTLLLKGPEHKSGHYAETNEVDLGTVIPDTLETTSESVRAPGGRLPVLRRAEPSAEAVQTLNLRIKAAVAREQGLSRPLVIVPVHVLEYVEKQWLPYVAGPLSRPQREHERLDEAQTHVVSALLAADQRAEEAETSPGVGYTLYLDYAAVATENPSRREIGHADSWEQLHWMAKGAETCERGGRLWATDHAEKRVLVMADMKLKQDPYREKNESCET